MKVSSANKIKLGTFGVFVSSILSATDCNNHDTRRDNDCYSGGSSYVPLTRTSQSYNNDSSSKRSFFSQSFHSSSEGHPSSGG